ncbi:MAG: 3D domain-containing protein, partial [Phycisphaerae bacterium]
GQCAAPSFIPFGSEIYIPALDRWFVVTDRTHQRFRHNTIDLFMPSRNQCLNFGRRFTDAVVVFPEKKHRYGCRSILKTVSAARSRDLQADANGKGLTLDGIVRAIFWGYSPLPSFSSRGGLNLGFPPVARHDEIAAS